VTKSRRRSIGAGLRHYSKKESQIKKEFKKINYVKASRVLSTPGMEDGHKKINQDSYIYEKNINGVLNFNIFGVLDGHGDFGHLASNFVKGYILNRIKNLPSIKYLNDPKKIYKILTNRNYHILTNIFLDADIQIKKEKFNCEMSGTTCVLVIQLDEHLICANTGDSRAILVYDESQNNLKNTKVFPLSHDAKPDLPREKERIIKCGGEVEKMVDEKGLGVGPFRVWAKGKSYPGLAMSRSIGDMDAKLVGVIPNPEFIEYKIDSKAKYIIVCSDGIWEFLSNEEVMKIANSFYLRNDPFGLCQNLTNRSTDFWLKDDNYVDDITVVSVFF
jgi:serine/threonine protein phosphatase PrpC